MNKQEEIWGGEFGEKYVDQNVGFIGNEKLFENKHVNETVSSVYEQIFGDLDRNYRILEVGCNVGHKLERLHRMGFKNLYGIDINPYAVREGRKLYGDHIIFMNGTLNEINPNEKFDLVMTNYVMIHVSPLFIKETLKKCYDLCRYLFHMEFDSNQEEEIKWLGKDEICWKRPMRGYYNAYAMNGYTTVDPILRNANINREITLPRSEDDNFDRAILWSKR